MNPAPVAKPAPCGSEDFMRNELIVLLLAGGGEAGGGALISALYVFALAAFLGYQVISRVPPLLHTPLMSATNAISAISVVGSILMAGGDYSNVSRILGFIAVVSAMINVVGGFMITDRMLKMFKDKIGGGGVAKDAKEERRG
jgi:H+-translocating NAD(P) transhydrogenase subunit alpha